MLNYSLIPSPVSAQNFTFGQNFDTMRYTLFAIMIVFLASCGGNGDQVTTEIVNNPNTASNEEAGPQPAMQFDELLFDFGDITQGERVNHDFTFTNNGEADLVIASAKGSCGCTVPDWPKRPIKPGETGVIKVEFNSSGKNGKQHKKVVVVANTQPSQNVIAISGNVIAPETQE